MGFFNDVVAEVRCPACGNDVNLKVQFKYGDVYQHHYRIGDVIQWDPKHPRTNVGEPGHSKVVVEGVEDCPICENEGEYEVWLQNDRIVAVKPATGAYDFLNTEDAYVVIED